MKPKVTKLASISETDNYINLSAGISSTYFINLTTNISPSSRVHRDALKEPTNEHFFISKYNTSIILFPHKYLNLKRFFSQFSRIDLNISGYRNITINMVQEKCSLITISISTGTRFPNKQGVCAL